MTPNSTFHQHLVEKLRALVRDGGFTPGAKFLTEREIAERFKTSRPTANKALSGLVSAGLLEVRRGAGTFVREGVLDYDLERLVSFTDKARAVGKKPGTELLEYRRTNAAEAPGDVAQALRVTSETPLIYMERIRLADRTPVIYERRHVVASLCPEMTRTDAKHSLYACWTGKCGLVITGADETIRAVNASRAGAALLQVPAGSACFKITATGYVDDETPLWHEETLYRADVYEFRNRISGLSGNNAAMGKIRG
ncbi:MAG: GntR family transcriptional regulator [Verrucomicrobiaceae bacterium]|jgi:GntR family transcriptional regulator|nr:GntR family transcriptional regulator [Verrucomicrobiaceae bacterium]